MRTVTDRPAPARLIPGLSPEEIAVIDHGRGHLHNGAECATCQAERRAVVAEQTLERLISG